MLSDPLQRALAEGRWYFRRRAWQDAHDAWSAARSAVDGDERRLLQALALWAAAAARHALGHTDEARSLLLRALEELSQARTELAGLVEGLDEALVRALGRVHRPLDANSHAWLEAPAEAPESLALEHHGHCPVCGAAVVVTVQREDACASGYTEDCPVCCRPWSVAVVDGRVELGRADR